MIRLSAALPKRKGLAFFGLYLIINYRYKTFLFSFNFGVYESYTSYYTFFFGTIPLDYKIADIVFQVMNQKFRTILIIISKFYDEVVI